MVSPEVMVGVLLKKWSPKFSRSIRDFPTWFYGLNESKLSSLSLPKPQARNGAPAARTHRAIPPLSACSSSDPKSSQRASKHGSFCVCDVICRYSHCAFLPLASGCEAFCQRAFRRKHNSTRLRLRPLPRGAAGLYALLWPWGLRQQLLRSSEQIE